MRSHFLNKRSAATAPRPYFTNVVDRELIGLCLVLLLVIGGHVLPARSDRGTQQEHATITMTMTQP